MSDWGVSDLERTRRQCARLIKRRRSSKLERTCMMCGDSFYQESGSRRKTCSEECKTEANRAGQVNRWR